MSRHNGTPAIPGSPARLEHHKPAGGAENRQHFQRRTLADSTLTGETTEAGQKQRKQGKKQIMKPYELKKVLRLHSLWVAGSRGGIRADLSGADLRSADLRSADLRSADLSGADLSGADLSGADLSGADLSGADLRSAGLRSAGLSGAGLSGADLSGADLRSADLSQSQGLQFSQVSFSGHGEKARMLTLAVIAEKPVFFCGCFCGSPAELAAYIAAGAEKLKSSRTMAMKFCLESIKTKREA